MNIIDYILKEAKVNKWSVLQDNQIKNMTDQFLAKNKIKEKTEKDIFRLKMVYIFDKNVFNFEDAKQQYYKLSNFLVKEIITKLQLQPNEEKRILIWLLERFDTYISIDEERLKEDAEMIKNNLKLYFKNKKEIHKDIYSQSYKQLKELVGPYRETGQQLKHQEFLSKPIVQGKEYKIYKVTDIDTCIKIGQNTSWCIQGEEYAKDYLSKGPLYLVTKNDHRFALLSFESAQFMDVNDNTLKTEIVKDIFSVWPESQKMLDVKKNADLIRYIENPSEEQQLQAVNKNGKAIQHIKNPSKKVRLSAIRNDYNAILYINDRTEEEQLEAVKQNGLMLIYIKNPSEQVQLTAIKQNYKAIEDIKNPSEQVQLAAVKQNKDAIKLIKRPKNSVLNYLRNNP
jgi:hypothetical protein